jgi:hypothetical protein
MTRKAGIKSFTAEPLMSPLLLENSNSSERTSEATSQVIQSSNEYSGIESS